MKSWCQEPEAAACIVSAVRKPREMNPMSSSKPGSWRAKSNERVLAEPCSLWSASRTVCFYTLLQFLGLCSLACGLTSTFQPGTVAPPLLKRN
ncbi:rCG20685, isoform CRA_b [Rattus norvegicus]|uniref:RCG20685, isoform CRA_b n=1 Tax=Rattus norvegicus TaxID=10116 RepID=A6JEF7_RAT|nr:rCG20685, isoform CRA_b [Rattus norvegicus]